MIKTRWCQDLMQELNLDLKPSRQHCRISPTYAIRGSTGIVTLHEDPPTLAHFGIAARDELMQHFEVCTFSFSKVVTWIKRRVDYILKAWMVNEIDCGPGPSNPKFLMS